MLKNYRNIAEKFLIYRKCAGAKCDPFKLEVRTRVRAVLNLDVRGAFVRPKKRSQLTPCSIKSIQLDIYFEYLIHMTVHASLFKSLRENFNFFYNKREVHDSYYQ